MNSWLYGLLIYLSILLLWGVINLVTFAVSFLRKKNYLKGLDLLNNIFLGIIQFGLFLWAGSILWLLFLNKEWLLLFLALMFGGVILNFYAMFYGMLAAPFLLITTSLSKRIEKTKDTAWQEYEGEIISDGKVVSSFMSDDKVNKRLAVWFLVDYFSYLFSYLIDIQGRLNWGWSDYVTSPIFGILLFSIPIMIIYLVYNLARHKQAFPSGFKLFFANTLRVLGYFMVALFIIWVIF